MLKRLASRKPGRSQGRSWDHNFLRWKKNTLDIFNSNHQKRCTRSRQFSHQKLPPHPKILQGLGTEWAQSEHRVSTVWAVLPNTKHVETHCRGSWCSAMVRRAHPGTTKRSGWPRARRGPWGPQCSACRSMKCACGFREMDPFNPVSAVLAVTPLAPWNVRGPEDPRAFAELLLLPCNEVVELRMTTRDQLAVPQHRWSSWGSKFLLLGNSGN